MARKTGDAELEARTADNKTVGPQLLRFTRGEKRLYDVWEAATYLGRSVNAIREMQWAGKLPYVKFDRRVFFDVCDLDRFIEQHKIIETF